MKKNSTIDDTFPRATRRIHPKYRRAFRAGIVTGILLAVIASVWLLVANRAPSYEQYAAARNIIAGILGLIVAVIPVVMFARSPRAVVLAGVVAWTILCACYFVWTFYFDDLDRVATVRFFMMGAVVYGFAAALAWLGRALLAARERQERHAHHSHAASEHGLHHS